MSIEILIAVSTAALFGMMIQGMVLSRVRRAHRDLAEKFERGREQLQQLEQELSALCSASVGAGDHLVKLEQQVQRIGERQGLLEVRAGGNRPYGQASQLVHKGADIEELVDTCGLTRGEAELLVLMQRGAA